MRIVDVQILHNCSIPSHSHKNCRPLLASSKCPVCGHQFNHVLNTANACDLSVLEPAVCAKCASFLVVAALPAQLRIMTLGEVGDLTDERRIQLQRARRMIL